MELRKFYATSMAEALTMVRTECGEDAVILDTRTIREPSDDGAPGAERVEVWVQCETNVKPPVASPTPAALAPLIPPAALAPLIPHAAEAPLLTSPAPSFDLLPDSEMAEELFAAPVKADDLSSQVDDLHHQLVAVHSELDLLKDGMGWMGVGTLEPGGELAQCIAESLAGKLSYSGGIRPQESQQHVVAFIGPTGVGKTTMVAKLAWHFTVLQGRSVGVITTDTVRMGAVDQLAPFCRHLDIPLEVVYAPEEMEEALARLAGCSLLLIDTPGGSPRNAEYLSEIHGLLAAADPMEVHLVMSVGSSPLVVRDIIRRYADLQPDQVILTKLDETMFSMELLPLLFSSGMAVSYLSGGQQLDRYLETATADSIYRFIIN